MPMNPTEFLKKHDLIYRDGSFKKKWTKGFYPVSDYEVTRLIIRAGLPLEFLTKLKS